jgi:hypothetical protein
LIVKVDVIPSDVNMMCADIYIIFNDKLAKSARDTRVLRLSQVELESRI